MAGVDRSPYQTEENRPTPELANHRTPIKNLYATGGSWHVGSNAGSTEAYNCYRIIAKDLGLGKPWEEPGKEEPDSLVEQLKITKKRVQDFAASIKGPIICLLKHSNARTCNMAHTYDMIIIGSGPNGLAIGFVPRQSRAEVLLLEKRFEVGGGLCTEQVTIPDFYHNTHAIYMMMVDYAPVYSDLQFDDATASSTSNRRCSWPCR